jgi:hypothetical protein
MNHDEFLRVASASPLLIDESGVKAKAHDTGDGFRAFFDLTNFPHSSTQKLCAVQSTNPTGSLTGCYFLPYERNASKQMTLGADDDFFLTSSLTGCTVAIQGGRDNPTVYHVNASEVYTNTLSTVKLGETIDDYKKADKIASSHAVGHMMAQLPDNGKGMAVCTKYDYGAKLAEHQEGAVGRFAKQIDGYSVQSITIEKYKDYKPEIGACVFGFRKGAGWELYLQTSVAVRVLLVKGWWVFKDQKTIPSEAVLLGPPERFYP